MKKSIIFILGFVCVSSMLNAQRLEMGEDINITRPVYENLYATGNNIIINAPVYGDLVTAGGKITINDTIQKDILLAGGNVVLNGFAGDDVRCAGGELYIKKDIKGDLIVTGGTVIIDKDIIIGGNLLVSGGDITLNGTVKGNVQGASGKFIMNGVIKKDINFKGFNLILNGTVMGKAVVSAADITVGNNAVFMNDVRYWNTKGSLDFKQATKKGQAKYDTSLKVETGRWYYGGLMSFLAVLWYLGTGILMIFLTQFLFSKTMRRASDTISTETVKSFGYGLLYLIGVPLIIVIVCVTVIGIPIGLILLFCYILTLALATVITSVVAANWINTKYNYNWSIGKIGLMATGVFIVLKLLSATFFMSWVFIVASLIAFGGIFMNINWRKKEVI